MKPNTWIMRVLEKKTHHITGVHPIELYYALRDKWPQINEKTHVRVIADPVIYIAKPEPPRPLRYTWLNKRGKRARIWRALCELFAKRAWYQRGQMYAPDPFVPEPATEMLQLERLGWSNGFDSTVITCAYHPATDTFYIRDESAMRFSELAKDNADETPTS